MFKFYTQVREKEFGKKGELFWMFHFPKWLLLITTIIFPENNI